MLLTAVLRLGARLLIVCLAISVALTLVGGRSPTADESWQHFGFDFCALPCFAGITPGQTPFDNVSGLLIRHVQSVDPRMIAGGASINFWAQSKSQQLGGLVRYADGLVGEMRFNVVLPLAELISELETPDCLLANTSSEAKPVIVIFWERERVSIAAVVNADAQGINLDADTVALWLNAVQANDCSRSGAVRWHGFAPLWDYVRVNAPPG
ncbi:MAG: hypothetical protein GC204_07080 [Chloroflexi bacterium]|nr:hypothetical protein [Chloroflexota bacterium]